MKDVKHNVSRNLTALRKYQKMTQAELAEKMNYSDKAISKWENGETLPDIEVLTKLTELYGVSLDYLINEHDEQTEIKENKKSKSNKIIISLLSASVIWILATIMYVYMKILNNSDEWMLFLWCVPFSAIIFLIFNSIWGIRRKNYIIISIFVWSLLACFFLQFLSSNIWPIFLLGIPFQIAIILWSQLKRRR